MSWFSRLPVKQAQTHNPLRLHLTTLSFPNTNRVSILKKAAFNGELSLQQVCLNVCGILNDVFNSLFLPLCATSQSQAHNYKMTVSIKPVSNLMHLWLSQG